MFASTAKSQQESQALNQTQLFADYYDEHATQAATNAKFGESVPIKQSKASFGDSVPLTQRPVADDLLGVVPRTDASTLFSEDLTTVTTSSSTTTTQSTEEAAIQSMKQRNLIVAVASILFAVSSYIWQFTHPITPVQLLASMQSTSAPLTVIGTNGRPTVVDFWAPWCENCKLSAPTLQKLEEEYADKVNFVMVNGDRPEAWPLIERFGVDAIPHMALISAEGDVETALIGPIPKRVLEADLNVLIANAQAKQEQQQEESSSSSSSQQAPQQELPFKMLDAFANRPELRRVKFVPAGEKSQ